MEENQKLIMVCLILYNLKRTYIIIDDADDYMEEGEVVAEAQGEDQEENQEENLEEGQEERQQPVPERTLGLQICANLMATMARAPGRLDRVRHP